jgi:hypothetical protein
MGGRRALFFLRGLIGLRLLARPARGRDIADHRACRHDQRRCGIDQFHSAPQVTLG